MPNPDSRTCEIQDHAPWTEAEHREAVNDATHAAEAWNRRHRRFADVAFFAAAAAGGTLLLNRAGMPSWCVLVLALIAGLAAWFALRSGGRVRSVGCMVLEWSTATGAAPLSEEEIRNLEQDARECPPVDLRLKQWRASGHVLRQRDHDAVVTSLQAFGVSATRRSREVNDVDYAEAL